MPLYKFGVGDVFYNQIKAHPRNSFFIYDSRIYLNNKATEPGSFVANVGNVPVGHVNLLEMNVDRAANSDETLVIGLSSSVSASQNVPDTGLIYPFVYKGTQKVAFKNIKRQNFIHDYAQGDVITGSYQMSASIVRSFYLSTSNFNDSNHTGSALKNSLSFAKRLGEHYDFPSGSSEDTNTIDIPSIFYGSEIKKGTVDLKFYITGTLVAGLKDSQYNGALIQYSGSDSPAQDGQVAGVVLYKEGYIILTGSWNVGTSLGDLNDKDVDGVAVTSQPSWLRYGMGANDNVTRGSSVHNGSASFGLSFEGTHKIPTITMLAHANRGELNYSNNPTYVESGQTAYHPITGSHYYKEQALTIKNVHSSSYSDPTGSLKKTTYITKVGIYDENKRLIGIASVAKPVKKTEERDLTFKLKCDI
tara:strand:+ start:201 stop:1451 length:1251 start_codon:yes stop_codon:yes gene_type:complete